MNINRGGFYEEFESVASTFTRIKIAGVFFIITNEFLTGRMYQGSALTHQKMIETFTLNYLDVNRKISRVYELPSTDTAYNLAIDNIKTNLPYSKTATFKAYEFTDYTYIDRDMRHYDNFYFDFFDIFNIVPFKKPYPFYSFPATYNGFPLRITSVASLGLEFSHKLEYHGSNTFQRLFSWTNDNKPFFWVPTFLDGYEVSGSTAILELFFKDNKFYLFVPSQLPSVFDDHISVLFDVYVIPFGRSSCCLAECFGITE